MFKYIIKKKFMKWVKTKYKDFIEESLCVCEDGMTYLFHVFGDNTLHVVNWNLKTLSFEE